MKLQLNILLLILTLFSSCTSLSSNELSSLNSKKLHQLFDKIEENDKSMGSISIFHKDKEVFKKSYGYQNIQNNVKANSQTLYRIGSITKTYTAVLILKMLEAGKLKLDTKLSQYFPNVPNANKITIEHLLRHRSGLVNYTDIKDYPTYNQKLQTKEAHLKRMIKNGIEFKPGQKYSYSNTGYIALSLILEKIENMSYAKILKKYITTPLKLKNTFYYKKESPKNSEAKGYVRTSRWLTSPVTHQSSAMGAGAIISTATDLAQFLDLLFKGKVLSTKSFKLMTKMDKDYGLGLIELPLYNKISLGHTGGIDGFRSIAGHFKEDDITYVHLSNAQQIEFNDMSIGLLKLSFGLDYKIPSYKELLLEAKVLNKLTGTYSSKEFPLEIKIRTRDSRLYAQASGQGEFPLSAINNSKFEFSPAGIKMTFNAKKGLMNFSQGGAKYNFKKK